MGEPSFYERMINHLRATSKYYTGYPKDLGPSRVIDFTSERDFVHLLHEGYPVVAAFTIRCNLTRHLDKVLEEAASEFYPHVKFIRVECPKYPGFCISRQKTEYPFIEIFHTPEQLDKFMFSLSIGISVTRLLAAPLCADLNLACALPPTTSEPNCCGLKHKQMHIIVDDEWLGGSCFSTNEKQVLHHQQCGHNFTFFTEDGIRSMGQVKTEEWNERDLHGSKLMGALLPCNTLSRGHLRFLVAQQDDRRVQHHQKQKCCLENSSSRVFCLQNFFIGTGKGDFLFENASERVPESEYKRLRAPSNQGRIVDTNITKYSVKVIPYNYDLSAYGFREFFKRHGIRSSDPK
ncbi:hypothetical protein G4B88_029611 [Cannabis sativa]|uniref:Uncharacterized protein n=1 Tax=Cannabis sativa TaxID=3483 RepID=A0A7J6FWS3_CANSA|nr:hypothetical protein G4B88_029611 [Cannabis sativa]